jgi:two-component system, response regulator
MKTKIILLVEDNADDVRLTRHALTKNNITNELVVAGDGVEALGILRRSEDTPALVLLDLKLPKMNGLEVLQAIRADERLRLLPVVMLTSSKEEQDVLKSYTQGANSYVRKPVDFAQFNEAVRQLGLYWLLLNEMPPTLRKEPS